VKFRLLLVASLALVTFALMAGSASAYPAALCGKFGSMNLFSHLKKTGNHNCPLARSLMSQYVRTKRSPSGYSCSALSWTYPAYCRKNSNSAKTAYLKRR
jgi:hypothetical protein